MSEFPKINSLRPQPTAEEKNKITEEKFREVSELYEKHFIREMMKQMRSTVHESGFIKQNNAEKIFRDQLDDQYADQWGKAGGIGLSGIIYDQLIQKYGEKMGLKQPVDRPQGPLELNKNSNFIGATKSIKEQASNSDPVTFKFETSGEQKSEIKNPWAGTLLDKKYLEMDQMQYRIKHDNGLESLISTRGTGLGPDLQLSLGDRIQSGQQLGWASAASPLFWTVKANVSE
jgi:peptidoglycan hydrolase FlgJ